MFIGIKKAGWGNYLVFLWIVSVLLFSAVHAAEHDRPSSIFADAACSLPSLQEGLFHRDEWVSLSEHLGVTPLFPWELLQCLLSTSPTVCWEFWPQKRQMPTVDICWVGLVWVKAISTAESSKQTQSSRPAMRMLMNSAGIPGLTSAECSSRPPRRLKGSSVCAFLMVPLSSPHKCFCTYSNTQKIYNQHGFYRIQSVQLGTAALTYTPSYMWE